MCKPIKVIKPLNWIFIPQLKLRGKTLLLYGSVVILPIVLLGFLAGHWILFSLRTDYQHSVHEAVNQVVKNVEFRKEIYETHILQAAYDRELINRLARRYDNMKQKWDTVRYIDQSFGSARYILPGLTRCRVYHDSTTLPEDGGFVWKPARRMLGKYTEEDWYQRIAKRPDPLQWETLYNNESASYDLTLSQPILDSSEKLVGVVWMQLSGQQVFDALTKEAFGGKGRLFLADANGVVFASTDNRYLGKEVKNTKLNMITLNKPSFQRTPESELVVVQRIPSGWYVIGSVSTSVLEKQTRRVYTLVIVITLSLCIMSILLMFFFIDNFTKRLKRLGSHMTALGQGDFEMTISREDADELGDLEEHFSRMARRLRILMEEIAYTRIKQREEALKALQAQINPHFLYNTLGMVRWRALDAGDQELCRIVDAMTTFYRLALNEGKSVLKVKDEINHVKAYLEIMQYRYPDKVEVYWDVDPETLDCYVIKLILQPLVENSFAHGLIHKQANGCLWIKVSCRNDRIELSIRDNGVGMDPETITRILSGNYIQKGHGYGIYNIIERLRLCFGDRGVLTISGTPGNGTTVTIQIPVCLEPSTVERGSQNA
ncbi:MAG TPA: sensor histidine kinase [Bacillota bacterium]